MTCDVMLAGFPQWSALPESVIASAEIADECVAKFISLVRARDYMRGSRQFCQNVFLS